MNATEDLIRAQEREIKRLIEERATARTALQQIADIEGEWCSMHVAKQIASDALRQIGRIGK